MLVSFTRFDGESLWWRRSRLRFAALVRNLFHLFSTNSMQPYDFVGPAKGG